MSLVIWSAVACNTDRRAGVCGTRLLMAAGIQRLIMSSVPSNMAATYMEHPLQINTLRMDALFEWCLPEPSSFILYRYTVITASRLSVVVYMLIALVSRTVLVTVLI